jgi:hypothetical protein
MTTCGDELQPRKFTDNMSLPSVDQPQWIMHILWGYSKLSIRSIIFVHYCNVSLLFGDTYHVSVTRNSTLTQCG